MHIEDLAVRAIPDGVRAELTVCCMATSAVARIESRDIRASPSDARWQCPSMNPGMASRPASSITRAWGPISDFRSVSDAESDDELHSAIG